MAIEDWIHEFDPYDDYEPSCRDCGRPIVWAKSEYSMKWVPTDPSGGRHRCPKKVASAREFPELED